jgi:type I restriction enzyme, S subunit
LEGPIRVEAEYYQPQYLDTRHAIVSTGLPIKHLRELCKRITDGSHITPEYQEEGVRFLMVRNVHEQRIDFDNVKFITKAMDESLKGCKPVAGDILLTKVGTVGVSAIVPPDAPDFNIFVSVAVIKGVQPELRAYVSTFLNSRFGRTQAERAAKGISQPDLHLEDIREFLVPVPPRPFADKITAMLKKAADLTSESSSRYAQAQALLAAELGLDKLDLSESLYSVRRVSEVRESGRADAEYYRRKYLNLLNYLDKQPHATLEDLTTFSGGATPLGAEYLEEGIPFLRIQNVGDNRLVLDDVAYIDETIHTGELKRSQLKPRDVLITITGRIGTSAVVPDDLEQANINQHIVRMRLKSNEMNPYYLAAFLNSVGGRLQTEREAYGTTRDALPYYCLARVRVLKADMGLQKEVERTIHRAAQARQDAQRLLAEAKAHVERMTEGQAHNGN